MLKCVHAYCWPRAEKETLQRRKEELAAVKLRAQAAIDAANRTPQEVEAALAAAAAAAEEEEAAAVAAAAAAADGGKNKRKETKRTKSMVDAAANDLQQRTSLVRGM